MRGLGAGILVRHLLAAVVLLAVAGAIACSSSDGGGNGVGPGNGTDGGTDAGPPKDGGPSGDGATDAAHDAAGDAADAAGDGAIDCQTHPPAPMVITATYTPHCVDGGADDGGGASDAGCDTPSPTDDAGTLDFAACIRYCPAESPLMVGACRVTGTEDAGAYDIECTYPRTCDSP